MLVMIFRDRNDAGRKLARLLKDRYGGEEGVVYALPRGGVPLAVVVAKELEMPLDLVTPRKNWPSRQSRIRHLWDNGSGRTVLK